MSIIAALFHYLVVAVAAASIALIALTWLEGAILIWLPRAPSSRFWNYYDRVCLTLKYISMSEEKLSRARFLFNSVTERTTHSEQ